jgi:hypothetical protein
MESKTTNSGAVVLPSEKVESFELGISKNLERYVH